MRRYTAVFGLIGRESRLVSRTTCPLDSCYQLLCFRFRNGFDDALTQSTPTANIS